jgi:hypothetical protein
MGELNGRVLFSDLQAMLQESHPVHLSKSINQPNCGILVTSFKFCNKNFDLVTGRIFSDDIFFDIN